MGVLRRKLQLNTPKTGKPEKRVSGWELVVRVARGVMKDDCDGYSAEIAFFLFFALFPSLLSLAALFAYLPVPDLFSVVLRIMDPFLPANVFSMIQENLLTLELAKSGGLFSFGVLLALWTASNAMFAIQTALNDAYTTEEQRPYWKVRVISVLLVICLTCFIIVSLLLLIFGPRIGVWIATLANLGTAFSIVWNIMRWPAILCLMMMALSALYRFAPTIRLTWRETFPGAVTATGAWVAITLVFSSYVNRFSLYVDTYGSIGPIIALLVWLYASAFVILVGGEINARKRELYYGKMNTLQSKGEEQMRKTIITSEILKDVASDLNWFDLSKIARVVLTSEDPLYPIESTLNCLGEGGWKASKPGQQLIRLLFDESQNIRCINLVFSEKEQKRTQEFIVRWSPDKGQSYREVVRQQYTFTPPDTTLETEYYNVELDGVTALELIIVPDISGSAVPASLAMLRLA